MNIKELNVKSIIRKYVFVQENTCLVCFNEAITDENNICEVCKTSLERIDRVARSRYIDSIKSAFAYDGLIKQAIKRMKYDGRKYIAKALASFLEAEKSWNIDFVIFVPTTQKKKHERGYNQSEELARWFCAENGFQMRDDILIKIRQTDSQTKLTREQRKANLRGAFKVVQRVKGLSLLLIDDVVTTGSTVEECARILKIAGAKRVYVLTVALTENA